MSDKQKVIVSLTLASKTCSDALSSLSSNPHEPTTPPALDILQKDLTSLLTLIHSTTTKCALALKPSSPTYQASLAPLKDLSAHTAALTHCAQLFNDDVHGAALAKEVISTAQDVIEAIRALVQTFLALQTHAGSGTGKAGEEYMVRTGGVHDLIDKAKGPKGLSKDNFGAVRKKWAEDRGTLEDAFREVGELVEEAGEEGEDDGENDDDGWDGLGLGSGKKMDHNELERTKQVHGLLRLTTILHKRILLDLLSPSPSSPIQNPPLDALLHHSTSLLTSTDDLISTLYIPQNPTSIQTELTTFIDIIKALQSGLLSAGFFAGGLEDQLGQMSVQDSNGGVGEGKGKKMSKDIKKWSDTCFEQIYKLASTFASTLAQARDDDNISLDAS